MSAGEQPIVMSREDLSAVLREAVSQTPPSKSASLTTAEMANIARDGVKRAFTELGIDCTHPLETQKDFAFIRSMRKNADTYRKYGITTVIGLVISGLGTLLFLGAKAVFGSK